MKLTDDFFTSGRLGNTAAVWGGWAVVSRVLECMVGGGKGGLVEGMQGDAKSRHDRVARVLR